MEEYMNQDKKEQNISFSSFRAFNQIPYSIDAMKEILEAYPRKLPKIIVFDDYLDEVGHVLKHMFTVLTHHYNCFTVISFNYNQLLFYIYIDIYLSDFFMPKSFRFKKRVTYAEHKCTVYDLIQ